MRKKIIGIVMLLAIVMFTAAPSAVADELELTLDRESINLYVNQTYRLTTAGENEIVVFTSSDDNIVTVDDLGTITAKAIGNAVVTASGIEGLTAECAVKVIEGDSPEDIRLDTQSLDLNEGDHHTLNASVYPEDLEDKSVYFYSSDPGVAKVDSNGYVTAVKSGVAVITVESSSSAVSKKCMVKVNAANTQSNFEVSVTGVLYSISGDKKSNYKVELKGAKGTQKENTDADGNFVFEGVKQGSYTMSVYKGGDNKNPVAYTQFSVASYNMNISCIINGSELVVLYQETSAAEMDIKDITLQKSSIVLDCGETYDMTFTVRPTNAGTPVLMGRSSDEKIATVDADNRITGISQGKATITFTTTDGKISKSCVVNVTGVNSNTYSWVIIMLETIIILLIVMIFFISYSRFQKQREKDEYITPKATIDDPEDML